MSSLQAKEESTEYDSKEMVQPQRLRVKRPQFAKPCPTEEVKTVSDTMGIRRGEPIQRGSDRIHFKGMKEQEEQEEQEEKEAIPGFYKIPEIPCDAFLTEIKRMYSVLEEKSKSTSEYNLFAQTIQESYYGQTTEEWSRLQEMIQRERAFRMALGEFHQNMMGSFPGWMNYKRGHSTGCDIGTVDETCVVEIKNNENTMNSSSKESVFNKLRKQKEQGKRAILVIVNRVAKKEEKNGIEIIGGREFYEELSGRSDFMDDLLSTMKSVFTHYKMYDALRESLRKP